LRNLAQIYYLKGQKEEALKLIETLLLMRENDEDLLELKKIFSGK
jgi:Flp pilus assembly protein TadD